MILTTSSFKGSSPRVTNVFRHSFRQETRRNVPFIVAFCLVAVFFLIMPCLTNLIDQNFSSVSENTAVAKAVAETYDSDSSTAAIGGADGPTGIATVQRQHYSFGIGLGAVTVLPVMAFILGLLQFAYLSSRRAMDVYGALPIRRGTFLRAKMTAGVVILYLPLIISYLLIFLANILIAGYHQYLLYELLVVLLDSFVLVMIPYCLTVLVSTISGTVLENIIYPVTLIFAPVIIYSLGMQIFADSIYGYAGGEMQEVIRGLLLPYYAAYYSGCGLVGGGITDYLLTIRQAEGQAPAFWAVVQPHLLSIGIWLLLCTGITLLAVFCMRRRKNERAGIKGASKALNVIACLSAILIGSLLVMCLFTSGWFSQNPVFVYIWFFASMILIFVIYQLITLQSARAMLKSWPLCAVCVALGITFCVFLSTNAFGWYMRLPDRDKIEAVSVSYTGIIGTEGDYILFDPEEEEELAFDDVQIIDHVYAFQEEALKRESMEAAGEEWGYDSVLIKYHMKNGWTVSRNYPLKTQAMAQAIALLNEDDNFVQQHHIIFQENLSRYDVVKVSDPYRTRLTEIPLDQIDMDILQQVLQQDILEETLEDILTPAEKEYGWIQLWDNDAANDEENMVNEQMSVLVKGGYRNTIAYLESIGTAELMEPDFSMVQEVALLTPEADENGSSSFLSVCLYGNVDNALHLFTKNWTSGITLAEDYDSMMTQDYASLQANTFTDPEKIQSILEDCYNQHEYNDESCTVYVKGQETVTELILPNP